MADNKRSAKVGGLYQIAIIQTTPHIYLYLGSHKMYIVSHTARYKIGTIQDHPENEGWLLERGTLLNES